MNSRKEAVASRLRNLGLDVGFLIWLEGEHERLPRIGRIRETSGAQLAAAVRGAVWMTSQFACPEVVQGDGANAWQERYRQLEAMLWNALRYSMVSNRLRRPDDIRALEETLELLLPPQQVAPYRRDIRRLRALGKPERIEDLGVENKKPKRGGRKPSEQTQRMRAAIEYVGAKSDKPFRDLTDLWNEQIPGSRYNPDSIRQRLRKGEDAGPQLLEFWRRTYEGEGWVAFPGRWPHGDF